MKWLMFLVGAAAGVCSGCGVGGGTLLLLWLTAVMGMEQRTAAGINLLYFLCCTPVALISHIRHRLVKREAWWPAALAGVAAAAAAAFLSGALPTDWLRRGFGVLLLYIGIRSLFTKEKRSAGSRRK